MLRSPSRAMVQWRGSTGIRSPVTINRQSAMDTQEIFPGAMGASTADGLLFPLPLSGSGRVAV